MPEVVHHYGGLMPVRRKICCIESIVALCMHTGEGHRTFEGILFNSSYLPFWYGN